MSIPVKVALVISGVIMAVIAFQTGTVLLLVRGSLVEMMQGDLTASTKIAERFLDTKINLLKAQARTVAMQVAVVQPDKLPEVFEQAQKHYPEFLSFTVIGHPDQAHSPDNSFLGSGYFADNKYLRKARQGETAISTSRREPKTGRLVINLFAPVDADRVLSVTIDGMYFKEMLDKVALWSTGRLFMLDEYGTILAHPKTSLYTQERYNFREIGKKDPELASVGAAIAAMLKTDSGTSNYDLYGQDFICAWQTLSSTTEGWVVAVSVPLKDTPVIRSQKMLLLAAALFLGLGILLAFLFARRMARPFILIEAQNQSLKELNEAIVVADEAKDHFLANMSHEMRTPLNAIIGLTEPMLREQHNCPPEHVKNLEKVFDSGVTLLRIINDILDISKMSSGKFAIIPVEYDLATLINDAVQQNMVCMEGKPVQMKLWVNPDIPATLFGDDLRIKQILNNILSNAVKYTHAGTVSLIVSFERGEGDNLWLLCTVKDTGIGIRSRDLDKIFKYYYQVDTKANRRIKGTGLGLPLTKHLVEMMDGGITVKSEYGRGSIFHIRIRQKIISEAPIGKEVADSLAKFDFVAIHHRHEPLQAPLPEARVLVVDDMVTNLDVFKGLAQPYNMRVDCVTNGQAAIDLIRAADVRYDAVFMDHMMPDMDGLEVVRIIRQEIDSEYARTVPIIALTANAVIGSKEMFLQSGFQAFISKPIDTMQLDAVIRQWIQDKNSETKETMPPKALRARQAIGANLETAAPAWEIEGLNFNKGLARFGGNMATYLGIVSSYVHYTPASLAKIRTVTPETLADYAVVMHGIKGSSRNFDAETVGNLAENLERAARAGDFAFVQEHNPFFIETTEKLLTALSSKLKVSTSKKPSKDKPDPAVLADLRQACETFDIDQMDRAMKLLTGYEYSSEDGAELAAWLEEKAFRLDFKAIVKRLTENQAV